MDLSPTESARDIRPLVRRLGKAPREWRRRDLVELCLADGIRVVNFRYPSLDGKLRELRLPVTSPGHLDRILAAGERVDGSSLYPGLFDPAESDLYAVPVYRWAFLDPWAPDELHIVCRFAGRDGAPHPATPDTLLADAAAALRSRAGLELFALAELELYLILERRDDRFTGRAQRNYHQSAPYLHGRPIADDILRIASALTGCIKYCHGEVGYIDRLASSDPELDGKRVEQYEVEMDLMPVEDLGCWLTVLRWLVRVIADRHGASVTYVPKLDEGMAGSGLHLHLALARDGKNVMRDAAGALTREARALAGGILRQAVPLTAFGNTVAASFLRLVPNQEAPTRLCWGASNRSALLRVPLDFATARRLDQAMNPEENGAYPADLSRPTIEYRSPDGSAFCHLLLAALTTSITDGLLDPAAEELAAGTEVQGNVFRQPEAVSALGYLPASAVEAARRLDEGRAFFEQRGFPPRLIELVIGKLKSEVDEDLAARLRRLPAAERLTESRRLMHKDLHKH